MAESSEFMSQNARVGLNMIKWSIIVILSLSGAVLGDSTLEAKQVQSSLHWGKVVYTTRVTAAKSRISATNYMMKARITVYSPYQKGELKVNHRGLKITNNFGIAVPKGTLKDGTEVYIEGVGIRKVDDRIPAKSVKKHKKIARKKRVFIDIVIDVRYNTKNIKGLRKNDLGYCDVLILGKR